MNNNYYITYVLPLSTFFFGAQIVYYIHEKPIDLIKDLIVAPIFHASSALFFFFFFSPSISNFIKSHTY